MVLGGTLSAGQLPESIVNVSSNIVSEVGQVGLWLQAIGVIVVLWLIFNIVSFVINRRNHNTIKDLKKDVERLERKIDNLAKKK